MKKLTKLRTRLTFNIISAVVILLIIFSWIVSLIGYISFTRSFKREYAETTYHIANTATTLVNGDNIDSYLEGSLTTGKKHEKYLKSEEYTEFSNTKEYLDKYCLEMNVSIVYVIKVDETDYGRFTSIFNSIGPDTPYTPWEIGYQQDTTNDKYAKIYKEIYEDGLEYGTIYRTNNLKGAPPHITTLVPVKNSQGKVVSIMCIQRPMKELKDGTKPYLINVAISAIVMAIIVSITYAIYMRREIVKPINRIVKETNRFARESTKNEEFNEVSKIVEISSLANSVDKMETDMINYIDNLTKVTSEKERIGAELNVAKIIQENSIPNIYPAFPDRKDFDIYASMNAAKQVGGDFYNFFLIDDDHLAFVIGDVSDKGIPAALFMMVTNILISDRTHMGGTPAEILTYVNDNICKHNKADMFVTIYLGIFEISTGKLTITNAGHDDAAIYRKDNNDFELLKTKHGLVVGAMPGTKYSDVEIKLNKGDKLFLYTDGVPEATNADKKMFTFDRMLKSLNDNKEKSPQEILESVYSDVNDFVGDAPQFDDLTMLCFEYKGKLSEITLKATFENVEKAIDFISDKSEELPFDVKEKNKIKIAMDEIMSNVVQYAYQGSEGDVTIKADPGDDDFTITVIDSGIKYNPLGKEDPDTTLSAEEREVGGYGIFLVKKIMDEIEYEYKDGKNILTMKKKFNK